MLFDGLEPLLRTLIVGTLAYLGLVVLLRVAGKRTLSKWNSFDFAVTVAYGSALATILLSRETALAEGLLALALLILLQAVVTWLSCRWQRLDQMIKARPALLVHRGQVFSEALRRERVTVGEIRAAARSKGHAGLEEVDAVVLETDGSFSVLVDVADDAPLADLEYFDLVARHRLSGGGRPDGAG